LDNKVLIEIEETKMIACLCGAERCSTR